MTFTWILPCRVSSGQLAPSTGYAALCSVPALSAAPCRWGNCTETHARAVEVEGDEVARRVAPLVAVAGGQHHDEAEPGRDGPEPLLAVGVVVGVREQDVAAAVLVADEVVLAIRIESANSRPAPPRSPRRRWSRPSTGT